MNYNFYTKALCALITCASMGIIASEITGDTVINHIAKITNTNAQSIKSLNAGHAIELSKNSYKNEYQAILKTNTNEELHNSLVRFYKKCIGKNDMQSQAAQAMLENLYSYAYQNQISNAQIIPQKPKIRQYQKELITNSDKNKNDNDEIIKESEKILLEDIDNKHSNEWNKNLTIAGITITTIALLAAGLGYYWYKK